MVLAGGSDADNADFRGGEAKQARLRTNEGLLWSIMGIESAHDRSWTDSAQRTISCRRCGTDP